MSRIGKAPISIPSGVECKVGENNIVQVKGPKGTLIQKVDRDIEISVEGNTLTVSRPTEQKRHKALHGLYRSLISNMVVGVHEGFVRELELIGVGYRASNTDQVLELSIGYSHPIYVLLPNEIKDKQLIGQVAAKIRSLRKPEPYKGKGIKYSGEILRRKAGKSAGKK